MSWAEDAWVELRGYVSELIREKAEGEGPGTVDPVELAGYMNELKTRYQRGGLTHTEWLQQQFGRRAD